MELTSQSFSHEQPIPTGFAFAKPDPETHATFSANRNPHLAWSGVPNGCRSLVLVCIDRDAPTVADDVNQEGRSLPAELPRADFVHWVMVDILVACTEIAAGSCSDGVTPGGKTDPPGPAGSRQGFNDYGVWFAGDPEMQGAYQGYDGPASPWNDERLHHYHIRLVALDIERCPVEGDFGAADVEAAIEGHVLAEATLIGTYTQNPGLLG